MIVIEPLKQQNYQFLRSFRLSWCYWEVERETQFSTTLPATNENFSMQTGRKRWNVLLLLKNTSLINKIGHYFHRFWIFCTDRFLIHIQMKVIFNLFLRHLFKNFKMKIKEEIFSVVSEGMNCSFLMTRLRKTVEV